MPTKKIQIPDINQYSQFRPFLEDFFKLNKDSNKNFSFRFFAKKLGWSASHLNDVMQGRRYLSLNKVLELIDFLGMKGVRAERVLLLALFESNGLTEKGKDFLSLLNSSMNVQTMTQREAQLMRSMRLQQVFHYIMSHDGVWNAADFISRSRKPKDISKSELTEILRLLEQEGLIRWDENQKRYLIEKTEFYQDTTGTDDNFHFAQKEFARTYLDFLDERMAPWTDFFGAVMIPRERLPEVFDRIAGLRNYLYEIRSQSLEKNPKTKFEVFHFSLSLFAAFRRTDQRKK